MIEALRRVLLARGEFQAALIATVDALVIFGVLSMTDIQVAAMNMLLVVWFGLAARLAFKRDIEELERITTSRIA